MSLIDCLLPATPPEPKDARVVRLLGPQETVSPESKLRYYRAWYARNRERVAEEARKKYHQRRNT